MTSAADAKVDNEDQDEFDHETTRDTEHGDLDEFAEGPGQVPDLASELAADQRSGSSVSDDESQDRTFILPRVRNHAQRNAEDSEENTLPPSQAVGSLDSHASTPDDPPSNKVDRYVY